MQIRTNRILIVSASVGSGHTQAARAVAAELKSRYPQLVINIADFMAGDNSYLNTLIKETYLKMVEFTPNMYDFLYRWTYNTQSGVKVQNLLAKIMKKSMLKLLRRYRPDMLICTHPFPCGAAAYLKRRGLLDIHLAGIITDFAVHSLWVYREVDSYFVAAENLKGELVAQGITPERIHVTGIPIHPVFSRPADRSRVIEEFQFDHNMPILLVMGGGLGLGGVRQALAGLNSISRPLQAVVVTGHNTALRRALKKPDFVFKHPMHVLGFTHQVRKLMGAASLLVTKPGALTLSEALAAELPMVLFEPIPGQEEENARYLSERGAARWVKQSDDLAAEVDGILADSKHMEEMKKAARAISNPFAAARVVDVLKERLTDLSRTASGY